MKKKNFKNIIGLTLVEILIGICITTIMMGAMYTSYNVVNQSYSRVTEKAKISRASRDLVTMLMRDIRMAGFKYYAGQQQINDFAIATTGGPCSAGVSLTRLSNLFFENGFDDPKQSHNPVVIRKNTLGRDATSSEASTTCCDQIQIVYEDFNQNHLFQPFKRYRITYYAKPNNSGSFAVWKRVESYIKERSRPTELDDCTFGVNLNTESTDSQDIDVTTLLRGKWRDTPFVSPISGVRLCSICTPGVMIRDHVEDMEFIPFDASGRIIQEGGRYPAPEASNSLRERLFDIRGVDVKLTFRSKEDFFRSAKTRKIIGLSDRNLEKTDKYLRDSVIVSVHTRNIGGQSFQ